MVGKNLTQKLLRDPKKRKVMQKKCVERYCELSDKSEQLNRFSTLCLDEHNVKKEELETVVEVRKVRSQIVLQCL